MLSESIHPVPQYDRIHPLTGVQARWRIVRPTDGGQIDNVGAKPFSRESLAAIVDKALAGRMLGISRATLYRKLKRYNIAIRSGAENPEVVSR